MTPQNTHENSKERLSAFSHDIKNVVTSAKINIAIVRQKLSKGGDEAMLVLVQRIDERLDEIVSRLNDFRKKEASLTP